MSQSLGRRSIACQQNYQVKHIKGLNCQQQFTLYSSKCDFMDRDNDKTDSQIQECLDKKILKKSFQKFLMLIILIWREFMRQSSKNLDLQTAERVLKAPQIRRNTYSNPITEQQFQDHEEAYQQKKAEQPKRQNSNDDYLFGDDDEPAVQSYRPKMQVAEVESLYQRSQQQGSQQNQGEIFLPVKRRHNTALSEVNAADQSKPKKKAKYKKQENMGNIFCNQKQVDNIFKHLCEPSGKITVNSLGHALQKYKINFEVRDVVEMMELYYKANNIEIQKIEESEGEIVEDQIGELNMSVKLDETQFKELYKLTRKKR